MMYLDYAVFFMLVALASGITGFLLGRCLGAREERARSVFWTQWLSQPNDRPAAVVIQPPTQGVN